MKPAIAKAFRPVTSVVDASFHQPVFGHQRADLLQIDEDMMDVEPAPGARINPPASRTVNDIFTMMV